MEDCFHLERARAFIRNLPKTIAGVYGRLLSSIPTRKLEARQALQWMAVSERALYLEEVTEAAMIEVPGASHPDVRLSTSFEIAKICAGLVSLVPTEEHEPYRMKVAFVHHTLKAYLLLSVQIESREAAFFATSELEVQKHISHISLGYLLSAIEDAPLSKKERANFPLLGYVLENWYKHMAAIQKSIPVPDPTLDRAVKLLDARYAQRGHDEHDRPGSTGPEGPEALYLENSNFPPPLYYASLLGLVDVVKKLLLRGDQHHDSGDYFGTPLQAAAYGDHWRVIEELVDKGADVNAVSGFYGSALQAASYGGQYNASGALLDLGANVNSLSGYYGTPLQAAAYGGHAELVFLLHLYGADNDIQGGVYGCALVAAVQGGYEETIMMLIKGSNLNAKGNKDMPNALYGASARGNRSMAAKLLNYGADPNKDDESGRSALEAAIQGGHADVVQLLLDNRATLNRASSNGLDLSVSALQMAAQGGHRDLVQQLLEWRVVDVNYQDKDGLSPFLTAVVRGHEAIVHLLLKKGVDTSLSDNDGLTALMMAVKGGNQSLVVLLLEYEADVGAKNKAGQTPLMLAVEEGHEAITFLLLQHGGRPDAPDCSGRTPLDVAASQGYQVIEKLLDFGVSGTAIADRDRFWKKFSRILTLPDEQKDCQELEDTSKRDKEKFIPRWVGRF